MRSSKMKLILGSLLLLFAGVTAWGQTITGDIGGTVADASGAVVVGAKVTATNVATNVATSAITNKEGIYSIRFLQVGTYKVTVVSAKGFKHARLRARSCWRPARWRRWTPSWWQAPRRRR